jgi:Tol biopolymer transport system component
MALVSGLLAAPIAASSSGPKKNGSIAFLRARGGSWPVFRIDTIKPDGSGLRTLARCAKDERSCSFSLYAWSPDGKRFAYLRGDLGCCVRTFQRPGNLSLFVSNGGGSSEKRVPGCGRPWPSCDDFAWAPDSSRIVVTQRGSLYVLDTKNGRRHQITSCPVCRDVDPSWSPDGSKIVFGTRVGSDQLLYGVNADGSGLKRLAAGLGPAWSPDGQRIAFAAGGGIYTVDPDGSNLRLVLSRGSGPQGTSPGAPSWSPDGTQLVFEVTPDTTPGRPGGFAAEIWTTKADGSGQKRVYRASCCISGPPAITWSPDGQRIAFFEEGQILVVHADGTHLRRLATSAAGEVAWQPLRSQRRNQ